MKHFIGEMKHPSRPGLALVGVGLALAAAGCGDASNNIDDCGGQATNVVATFDSSEPGYHKFSDPNRLAQKFEREDRSKIDTPLVDIGTSTHWGVGNIACKRTDTADKEIVIKAKVIGRARLAFPLS